MKRFYIVMSEGKVLRIDPDDDCLDWRGEKEAGALFDDYDQARNAVRRTRNVVSGWKMKIVRVELPA